MRNRNLKIAGVACVVFAALAFARPAERYFDIAKSLDIYASLLKEVNEYYVDETNPKKLVDISINGMLDRLDPYTDYISKENAEAFSIQTTGQYAGIGALVGRIYGKTVVTNPYVGFPAYQAGIHVGDELISIDGKDVQGKATNESSALLKGAPKTEVLVEVKRYGEPGTLKFKIVRERIKISNVTYQGLIDKNTGYIKLDEFTPGAGREMAEAVIKLKSQGAEKLILDLRDNPGGSLYEAINIAGLFIPKGKEVVSTKGKSTDSNKTYTTLSAAIDLQIPLAILINEGTASASEIVAGSLQDYDRALLLGQRTFGKGLVQTTRQLPYDAQLKVTTAKYYIPSGRCIQAIDYAHRKSDGSVSKFADSVKREFKTKAGRKVYDDAGLDPDITVKDETISQAVAGLISSGLIFEYANRYCGENKKVPADLAAFSLNEEAYQKFAVWVKTQQFEFMPELEKKVNDLMISAREEKNREQLIGAINILKSRIKQSREEVSQLFKADIKKLLEQEIVFHYGQMNGQMMYQIPRDGQILAARKALNDLTSYHKQLSPN
ncbi:MAG: S41 family peptidase [Bacteroidetes bacterium]|nr:S41 family peptidase [Bacteroidota bacterium]MBS1540427.1 S41 family peptidase [Bacteroidota bacterium]